MMFGHPLYHMFKIAGGAAAILWGIVFLYPSVPDLVAGIACAVGVVMVIEGFVRLGGD